MNSSSPLNKMTIQIFRPQHIQLQDLEEMDLSYMDKEQLLSTCKLLLQGLTHTKVRPYDLKTLKSSPIHRKTDNIHIDRVIGNRDDLLGTKAKYATSKYHYVYFDATTKKYAATITSKKKSFYIKPTTDELTAALRVDDLLNEINDKKRPRNRDEFHEVKEAYYDRRKAGDEND